MSTIATQLGEVTVGPLTASVVLMALLLVVLLVLSGLASGSEAALFSLTPAERETLTESESSTDQGILRLLDDPQRLLATILISNNLINVSIVMISAAFCAALVDFHDARVIQFVVESVVITLILLFFGEIVPKIFASSHHIGFARVVVGPLGVASSLFKPFARLLMKSAGAVGKRLSKHQSGVSADDLSHALELTGDNMTDEKDMLEGIVKFMDLEVCDIMTPRVDVVCIDYDSDFEVVLESIVASGYSRLPVIGEMPDDIKGILYVKDVLRSLGKGRDYNWHPLIRKGFFIPESKKINDLLTEFQGTKTHMAIIVDEYGCMQGVITLEDIMEEIVGDISDEQDQEEREWRRLPNGDLLFEAKISVNDLCKVLDVDGETFEAQRGEAETLAGLLLEKTGLIPRKGEVVRVGEYDFEVVSADQRRILEVKMAKRGGAPGVGSTAAPSAGRKVERR